MTSTASYRKGSTYLEPSQVPKHLQTVHGYRGRTFKARTAENVTITSNYWDGGSRSYWALVRLDTGAGAIAATDHPAFDARGITGSTYQIPAGYCVVEHVIFCGKDLGLRFYVRPEDIAPLLPAPVTDLSGGELRILGYFAQWRSCPERKEALQDAGLTDDVRNRLAGAGYLKVARNGATRITIKGRNASSGVRL